ncbi:hypothetical protein, partial [Mycolicibacterium frederiksbergense]|uniref:hypothetical protein n=1 Tax=Mycolicibacterium frederiksbergense TaxID=117567 RepID=UPI0039EDFB99
ADCSAAFFFATSSSVVITAPFSPSIAQRVSAGNTVISTVPQVLSRADGNSESGSRFMTAVAWWQGCSREG